MKHSLFFLIFICGINGLNEISIGGLTLAYVITIVSIVIQIYFITTKLALAKLTLRKPTPFDLSPLLIFFVYLYGLALGLIYENQPGYIIRNFAALSLLPFVYYTCIYFFSAQYIFIFAISVGLLNLLVTISAYFLQKIGLDISLFPYSSIYGTIGGATDYDAPRFWYSMQTMMYSLWSALLFKILIRHSKRATGFQTVYDDYQLGHIATLVIWALLSVAAFILPLTKGGFLAAIAISITVFFFSPRKAEKNWILISFSLLTVIFTSPLWFSNVWPSVSGIFSSAGDSNSIRYEQFHYLIEDLDFFGRGLGATIPGYARSEDQPYGFELTYVNLIHKFGFFGVLLGIFYFYIFFEFARNLRKRHTAIISAYGLGMIAFIFPSIGNPMLLSLQNVIALAMCIRLLSIIFAINRKDAV